MKSRNFIIILILIAITSGVAYWYFFFNGPGAVITPEVTGNTPSNRFVPIDRNPVQSNVPVTIVASTTPEEPEKTAAPIPRLRLLSNTPVGGYGASTTETFVMVTASSTATSSLANAVKPKMVKVKVEYTTVRWVDRGRGNVYEARLDDADVFTISNTILPRVQISLWNANLTAFVGSMLSDADAPITTIYAELKKQNASTSTDDANITPYVLKGRDLPSNVIGYAVSPKGNRIFILIEEKDQGVGYIANFDGSSMTRIFDSPLTQVNVEWPEENTIAITTKGSSSQAGYLYFVDPKTGSWKNMLGPLFGLSAKVSRDAKFIIASSAGKDNSVITSFYSVGTTTPSDAVVKTLADKCAWGNYDKEIVYCAVPSTPVSAEYPDDWYRGNVSFTDKIWQINASTGEIRFVSSLVDQSDRVIDVSGIILDQKDNFLFFTNKNDLSLWSLNLNTH